MREQKGSTSLRNCVYTPYLFVFVFVDLMTPPERVIFCSLQGNVVTEAVAVVAPLRVLELSVFLAGPSVLLKSTVVSVI